ncbi:hypothetical protein LOTGIDRAFT_103282 [Lottia gigantea]|uniref:inositol-phosphate phosphatase n=1 Tax=Lottia gigantea TaxID=225164 RepID=V4CRS0_LOTGI|nr:hypothetical protein LOTGIDRAFT_103282 [Lottia gigantea]ESP05220.1 hypothetical protein LOTGIDRAFT_103282 [Lottia gigantea]
MAPVNVRLNPTGFVLSIVLLVCIALYAFGLPSWLGRKEERISMKELLSVSIELARRGGVKVKAVAESHKLKAEVKSRTEEGAKEMRTDGDMESHRELIHGFAKAYPAMKVISEEHDRTPVDLSTVASVNKHLNEVREVVESDQSIPISQITIWVDPLDATKEYTENLKEYVTTMVCVAVKGQPVIGVIHKPFEDSTAWAWVGYGHSKNLQKADRDTRNQNKKIIVSMSHTGTVAEVAKQAFGLDTTITRAGGAGYKTLEVIKGNAHAYVHSTHIKKWDICAGNAILSAVDGKMTTLNGDYIDYSFNSERKVKTGLLATIYDHNDYLEKLQPITKKEVKVELSNIGSR